MSGLHMSWGWEGSRSCCPEVKTIISLDLIISLINPAIWILSNTLHSSENRWKVQCRMDRGVNQPLTTQWLLDLLRVRRWSKRKGKRTAARGSEVSIWHRLFRGGAPVKKHCGKTQERVNKGGTQGGSLLVFVIFSFPTFYDYFWLSEGQVLVGVKQDIETVVTLKNIKVEESRNILNLQDINEHDSTNLITMFGFICRK